MLSYLERGLRAPSTVVAERLMEVYGLCGREAEALLEAAIPDRGKAWRPPEHRPAWRLSNGPFAAAVRL